MNAARDGFSLDSKLALVTGASRGIGAAIAEALGAAGASVIGTATTVEGADRISERLDGMGIKGRGIAMDISDPASIAEALDSVIEKDGAVAVLVNNAGITRDNLLVRMKATEWDEVIATNLSGIFHLCKACVRPMMKAQFGRIVNVASVVGVMGNAGQANYAATKAGIIGFSKSLAREVGSRGITVNVVAPGYVQTAMTEALSEEQRELLTGQIPLHRLGEPADIAGAVRFLASPAAGYITGETLHVNGGMYMI